MLLAAVAAVAVVGLFSVLFVKRQADKAEDQRQAQALCAGLDAGLPALQIHDQMAASSTPREFAVKARFLASGACPEQLETNQDLREWDCRKLCVSGRDFIG
jgi:hypothetical protein